MFHFRNEFIECICLHCYSLSNLVEFGRWGAFHLKVTFLQLLENLTRRQEKKPSAWGISGVFDGCHFQMEKMLACVRYRCVGMNALYDCIAFIRVEIENRFAFDMKCLLVFWTFTLTKSNTPKICWSNLIKMINSSISS